MRLRTSLAIAFSAALILPWSGLQFIRQIESLLRKGQEQAQIDTAQILSRAIESEVQELPISDNTLYVHSLETEQVMDGHGDEYASLQATLSEDEKVSVTFSEDLTSLYGYIEVIDLTRMRADAYDPLGRKGDRIELTINDSYGMRSYVLANAAPGSLQVKTLQEGAPPLQGEWQETNNGYRVEFRIPRPTVKAMVAIAAIDQKNNDARTTSLPRNTNEYLPLLRKNERLEATLSALLPKGDRARIASIDGWVICIAGELSSIDSEAQNSKSVSAWHSFIYSLLIGSTLELEPNHDFDESVQRFKAPLVWQALSGLSASSARTSTSANSVIVSAAVPIKIAGRIRAVLLLEKKSDALLLLTNQAIFGVLMASLIALLFTSLMLVVYAGALSTRIRKLRNAAERALKPDGRLELALPHLTSQGDVGDLSRSFARLLGEVSSYTDYLKTLASKLSHELNTPLAIVRSSLDNLEHEPLSNSARTFAQRAREGAERLSHILRSMAEASRLEKAIQATESEDFDLGALVRACGDAYQDLVSPKKIILDIPNGSLRLHGAPDLIAQALDKLIDNARFFAPEQGWIRIRLTALENGAELTVSNNGPPLPERMQERLFDSLVSVRETAVRDEVPHLGLGLFVVRLVAELHGGQASASNLPELSGVEFKILLSGMQRRSMA
jgi:two-component system sensor histidine kinase ChvG